MSFCRRRCLVWLDGGFDRQTNLGIQIPPFNLETPRVEEETGRVGHPYPLLTVPTPSHGLEYPAFHIVQSDRRLILSNSAFEHAGNEGVRHITVFWDDP